MILVIGELSPQIEEQHYGRTSAYGSECYNKLVKSDSQIQAAEKAGKTPMTKNAGCNKCGKSTVAIYYES